MVLQGKNYPDRGNGWAVVKKKVKIELYEKERELIPVIGKRRAVVKS
jgi:hypothetical protein